MFAFCTSSALSSQPAGTLSEVHLTGVPGFVGERSPRTPSGPGWFWARVSTMNRWSTGTKFGSPDFGSSALPGMRSFPAISGSSSFRGTKTVPPLFTVWSTPWSKN